MFDKHVSHLIYNFLFFCKYVVMYKIAGASKQQVYPVLRCCQNFRFFHCDFFVG